MQWCSRECTQYNWMVRARACMHVQVFRRWAEFANVERQARAERALESAALAHHRTRLLVLTFQALSQEVGRALEEGSRKLWGSEV